MKIDFDGLELRMVKHPCPKYWGRAFPSRKKIRIAEAFIGNIETLCHEIEHIQIFEALTRIGISRRKAMKMLYTTDKDCGLDPDLHREDQMSYLRMVGLPLHPWSLKYLPKKTEMMRNMLKIFRTKRGNIPANEDSLSEF